MMRILAAVMLSIVVSTAVAGQPANKVLIVYDEKPQMDILAKRLQSEGFGADFVSTKETLPAMSAYHAVIVFIHRAIPTEVAKAVADYTKAGGRTVALHHTISSGKVKTPIWLEFLGIELLLKQPVGEGGYAWEEGVLLRLVNLAPGHYITTHNVSYPTKAEYKRSDVDEPAQTRDCVDFPDSEVYINHRFIDGKEKTILCGFICRAPKLGDKTWMQDRGGWLKKSGKGWIFYFMPGHSNRDMENPVLQQVIVNCLTWKP